MSGIACNDCGKIICECFVPDDLSPAEVEGTVPSSWYLQVKAERDGLVLVAEAVVNDEWEAARELADDALAAQEEER